MQQQTDQAIDYGANSDGRVGKRGRLDMLGIGKSVEKGALDNKNASGPEK